MSQYPKAFSHLLVAGSSTLNLVDVVNEVTARTVRAEATRVKRSTEFRLVARMTINRSQLGSSVCKLTFVAVPTRSSRLLVRAA